MFIGIDLGTTGCKVICFGESGNILHLFNREYPLICQGNHVAQDALLWWELVCEGFAESVQSRKSHPHGWHRWQSYARLPERSGNRG